MTDEPAAFDLQAAWVRKAEADLPAFVEGLAARLEEALPDRVTVERVRDGFLSSVRHVRRIAVTFEAETLTLERSNRDIVASRSKVVNGVRIRTERASVADWLASLDRHIRELATGSHSAASALHDFLMA